MTSTRKKYQYEVDNKLRGAYGETDLDRRVIRINKRRHRSKSAPRISPKKDGDEHLGKTIYHEELHRKHPKMHEKMVRRKEKEFDKLSDRQKQKLYKLVR